MEAVCDGRCWRLGCDECTSATSGSGFGGQCMLNSSPPDVALTILLPSHSESHSRSNGHVVRAATRDNGPKFLAAIAVRRDVVQLQRVRFLQTR